VSLLSAASSSFKSGSRDAGEFDSEEEYGVIEDDLKKRKQKLRKSIRRKMSRHKELLSDGLDINYDWMSPNEWASLP
jgi:hypothetical protein